MAAFTGFPLLRKELVEQAARWRTYLVRILFSLFLLGLVVLYLPEFLTRFGLRDSPEAFLGSGRAIFNLVTNVLFIGIHLVLPALMAGALSAERERGSLDLLRVTDLGPTEILLEKYLSRLVLMLTLLLTALPLLALAYSFGGVSADRLQRTAVLLLLACLQVGAISLFCSARCKTVLRAVIWAYLGCLAFYCILPLILILFPAQEGLRYLYPFLLDLMSQWPYWSPSLVFLATLFILLSCLLFLFLARQAFVGSLQHRAVPGSGGTGPGRPRSSRRVDPDRKLPGDRPVAWREAGRGRLTRAPFFSLIIGGEFLLFFNLLALAGGEIQYASSFMVVLNWMVAGLVVPLRSVNAVASERVRQTLDVLLTTPLTGMEILRQKVRGLWPTWWIFFWFMAPFYLMKALWLMSHHDFESHCALRKLPKEVHQWANDRLFTSLMAGQLMRPSACLGSSIS